VYHKDCMDGFGAAPVAWKKFGGEASYIPVSYGTEQDSFVDDVAKSAERPLCELYVLDFSFNIGQLGGVAVIRVGAPTEAEMKSKKEAFDDAISSTKAAVAEGIVPGGGLALLRCIEGVQQEETKCDGDERTGVQILRRALEILTRQIAENSAVDGGVVVARMIAGQANYGFRKRHRPLGSKCRRGRYQQRHPKEKPQHSVTLIFATFFGSKEGHYEPGSGYECVLSVYG